MIPSKTATSQTHARAKKITIRANPPINARLRVNLKASMHLYFIQISNV